METSLCSVDACGVGLDVLEHGKPCLQRDKRYLAVTSGVGRTHRYLTYLDEMMSSRAYDPQRDREAVHRIWDEIGWTERGNENHRAGLDMFLAGGDCRVAEVHGQAEFLVSMSPGQIRYQDEPLPFSGVMAVTTSLVARKLGLARRYTAEAIAQTAEQGAIVSGLGMFEQGFYDHLGFGTGPYEHRVAFDPSRLKVANPSRPPYRLSVDHWQEVHENRLRRMPGHGKLNFTNPEITRAEMVMEPNAFGLGYRDTSGKLTHHVHFFTSQPEFGPLIVNWMAYSNWDEFLELISILRSFGEQYKLIVMQEPAEIQLQDFVDRPIAHRTASASSKYDSGTRALAYWQLRMNDIEACLSKTHMGCKPFRFNLELADPIERFLEDGSPWRGVSGEYVVTLGEESSATRGSEASLPTLQATVNAFTRMWMGVRPASGLAVSDELEAPPELLRDLDEAFRLPAPLIDWDF